MSVFFVGPECEAKQLKKILSKLKCKRSDTLIAIDGGLATLSKLKLDADIALGDWDSLREKARQNWKNILSAVPHLSFSKEKNESDLRLAIEWAGKNLRSGKTAWYFLGVTGGREDHHLASLFELSWASDRFGRTLERLEAWDGQWQYAFLSGVLNSWGFSPVQKRQIISVFPLFGSVRGVTLQGVKYKLKNADLLSASHGLSNEVHKSRVGVKVKSGRLVVCRNWKGK